MVSPSASAAPVRRPQPPGSRTYAARRLRHARCRAGLATPFHSGWIRIPAASSRAPSPSRCACLSESEVWCSLDESADALARDRARDGAVLVDVEDDERKLVLRAERDRGLIHHPELLQHHVAIADRFIKARGRLSLGIG